ncbi:hypothetical protein EAE96_008104 [Botrytis aclada]|nr:hypothetical protein EAE96_008104 [Botrytis aclada]
MPKRPAASGMSSSVGSPKKQRLTKPVFKDYLSLSVNDLISKDHLEVVQVLVDLGGAYKKLQVAYRRTKEELNVKAYQDQGKLEEMVSDLNDMEYEDQERLMEMVRELTYRTRGPCSRASHQSLEVTRLIKIKDELESSIADNEEYIESMRKYQEELKEECDWLDEGYDELKEENAELKTQNEEKAMKIAWLEAQIAEVAAKPRRNTAAAKNNSSDVTQQAKQLQDVMRSAIKAQIKWAPSCKTSGKRWSYTCVVPSADVFYTLFNMDAATELGAKKQWKQKKISIHDFKDIVGRCFVKIRYNSLELVGKDVILRWDAEANSFTVSGKYGVPA